MPAFGSTLKSEQIQEITAFLESRKRKVAVAEGK
jgi:hypothetical protein